MMRPVNSIMGGVTIIIGFLNTRACTDVLSLPGNIFLMCLAGFFISGSGMIINDIYDFGIDRVNRPRRPLPSGRITIGQAKLLYGITLGLGMFLAIWHGMIEKMMTFNMIFVAFFGFIAWLYAAYGKKSGFLGNIIVSLSYPAGFIYGAIINGYHIPAYIYVFYMTSFSLLMAREIIKGCEDIKGDKPAGVRTLAITIGIKKAVWVSVGFGCLAIIFFILPVFTPINNPNAFLFLMIPGIAVVMYAIRSSFSSEIMQYEFRKISLLLKLGALLGLLAFLLASFRCNAIINI